MSNSFSPVPPFNGRVPYVDPATPHGFTQQGYRQMDLIQRNLGVFPQHTGAPSQATGATMNPGTHVYDPNTNILYIWDGAKWNAK